MSVRMRLSDAIALLSFTESFGSTPAGNWAAWAATAAPILRLLGPERARAVDVMVMGSFRDGTVEGGAAPKRVPVRRG